MARPLRIEFEGAIWHVTSRGNRQQTIFTDDQDRESFLDCLGKVTQRYRWLTHTYVLMDNHHHLVIETPVPTLSRGMRQLNGVYAQRFNCRHSRSGHLFQGRFDSQLIQRDSYLLAVLRYVVLNPVRASVVARPEDWQWSSYRATVGLDPVPPWLQVDWTLRQFDTRSRRKAVAAYQRFVLAGVGKNLRIGEEIHQEPVLGDEAFRESVQAKIERRHRSREHPRAEVRLCRPSMTQVIAAASNVFGMPKSAIVARGRNDARQAVALIAQEYGLHTLATIGASLSLRETGVFHLVKRARERRTREGELESQLQEMRTLLAKTAN